MRRLNSWRAPPAAAEASRAVLLAGRGAIVTGAGRGLGRAMAGALAREGADILIAEIDRQTGEASAQALRDHGHRAWFAHCDVADEASVVAMVDQAMHRLPAIDVVVNNAALVDERYRRPFWEFSVADWDRMQAVNLRSVFLVCRAVFPHMRGRGTGSIINIASATIWYGLREVAPYVASKGGVLALSRVLANEMGAFGIRVNTVTPGHVVTDRRGMPPEVVLPSEERPVAGRALKRPGLPEDIADVVVFLASDLSRFVTGQALNVDGGYYHH